MTEGAGHWLFIALAAASATAAQMPILISRLRSAGVHDVPNDRSSHTRVTVRGGGMAMVVPALVGSMFIGVPLPSRLLVFLSLLVFAATGFVDDIRDVGVRWRLCAQALAAGFVAIAVFGMSPLAVPAVLLVVSVVNAFNFMDGINGISAATLIIAGGAYGILGLIDGIPPLAFVGFLCSGLGLGFLPFNFPTAQVFLGDAGSYLGGGLLGVAVLWSLEAGTNWFVALAPIALYGADTFTTLARRALRRERIAQPHRDHAYQRLAAQIGHPATTGTTAVLTLGIVLVALVKVEDVSEWQIGLAVAACVAFLIAPRLASAREWR